MVAGGSSFVGRVETLARLKSWLMGEHVSKGKLSIGSISGAAGIGKTYLLEHALRECKLERRRYVELRFSGAHAVSTLASAVHDLVGSARNHGGRPIGFPKLDDCRRALKWMDAKARKEIEKEISNDPELAKTIADVFVVFAGLAQFVPYPPIKVAAMVASTVPKRHVESVVRLIQKAVAYQTEKVPIPGRGRGDARLRNNLRSDMSATLATALISDLSGCISSLGASSRLLYRLPVLGA